MNNTWKTPDKLKDEITKEFGITLDPCIYPIVEDGLAKCWKGETVFINPPYGRGHLAPWILKAIREAEKHSVLSVMLLPVDTSTRWFHELLYNKYEIRFIKGRVKFKGPEDSVHPAPFASMIVIIK